MKWCFAMSLNQRHTVKVQCYLSKLVEKTTDWHVVVVVVAIPSLKMCMHHQIRFSALTVNLETPKKEAQIIIRIYHDQPQAKPPTAKPSVSQFFFHFFQSLHVIKSSNHLGPSSRTGPLNSRVLVLSGQLRLNIARQGSRTPKSKISKTESENLSEKGIPSQGKPSFSRVRKVKSRSL